MHNIFLDISDEEKKIIESPLSDYREYDLDLQFDFNSTDYLTEIKKAYTLKWTIKSIMFILKDKGIDTKFISKKLDVFYDYDDYLVAVFRDNKKDLKGPSENEKEILRNTLSEYLQYDLEIHLDYKTTAYGTEIERTRTAMGFLSNIALILKLKNLPNKKIEKRVEILVKFRKYLDRMIDFTNFFRSHFE